MSDGLVYLNLDEVLDEIVKSVTGSVRISNESLKDNKDNLQYRTSWALKDAEEDILSLSHVSAAFDDVGDWNEGEQGIQRLARQVYGETISHILEDKRIPAAKKDTAKRAITLSGRWGE